MFTITNITKDIVVSKHETFQEAYDAYEKYMFELRKDCLNKVDVVVCEGSHTKKYPVDNQSKMIQI